MCRGVELPQLHILLKAIYDGHNSRALQHHHAHQNHAAPYRTNNASKVTLITPFRPYYTWGWCECNHWWIFLPFGDRVGHIHTSTYMLQEGDRHNEAEACII